jgi:hypothetical protein
MTPPEDALRRKQLLDAFQMPSVASMVSRKSSITNAFVNTLIPQIKPTVDEIEQALSVLAMDPADVRCAYCGDPKSEWDHLRPLVLKQRPTGYITEIANLVPACRRCNQSKGNAGWRKWMVSTSAPHSPTARGKLDVAERMVRLEDYERWKAPIRIENFETIIGANDWDAYWKSWQKINADLRECQRIADGLRAKIEATLQPRRTN